MEIRCGTDVRDDLRSGLLASLCSEDTIWPSATAGKCTSQTQSHTYMNHIGVGTCTAVTDAHPDMHMNHLATIHLRPDAEKRDARLHGSKIEPKDFVYGISFTAVLSIV